MRIRMVRQILVDAPNVRFPLFDARVLQPRAHVRMAEVADGIEGRLGAELRTHASGS